MGKWQIANILEMDSHIAKQCEFGTRGKVVCRVAMAEWLARVVLPTKRSWVRVPPKASRLFKTVPCGLRVATMVPRFTRP